MKVQQLLLFDRLRDQLPPSSPSTSSSPSSFLFSSQTPATGNSQHGRRPWPTTPPASSPINTSAPAIATATTTAAEAASEFVHSPISGSSQTVKCISRNLHAASLQIMQSAGGTRWSPMPEQIKVLEALYNGGMRTPTPLQIERITAELGKYGRIEGKNVFYWFQNHKARERQKQKRCGALLPLVSNSDSSPPRDHYRLKREEMAEEMLQGASCKRKCRRWRSCAELEMEEREDRNGAHRTTTTLELFPLQPEYWKQQQLE